VQYTVANCIKIYFESERPSSPLGDPFNSIERVKKFHKKILPWC